MKSVAVGLKVKPVFTVEGDVGSLEEEDLVEFIREWMEERPLMEVRVLKREEQRLEVEVDFSAL